jgi:TPP-dependent pyruvate/acetoin dehydrogenase alpha subunit
LRSIGRHRKGAFLLNATATLLTLYREMVRARTIEEVVLRLCDDRSFQGFYHPGRGQEATPIAICAQLRPGDSMFYAHRGLGYLTAKGMDPVEILGDFAGTVAGSTRGLGAGTVHCVAPDLGIFGQGGTLGSAFPLATGTALAFRARGEDSVAVAFFGDGAAARGTFLESAVVAVARRLPVIYVCENNGFAVSVTPLESQGTEQIAERARGFGMPAHVVDGTDVGKIHDLAADCIERARAGEGPSFIETLTTRNLGHFAGDLQPYRPRGDGPSHIDPIEAARSSLLGHGATAEELDEIDAAARREMDTALERALAAPKPGRERLFEGVWA